MGVGCVELKLYSVYGRIRWVGGKWVKLVGGDGEG